MFKRIFNYVDVALGCSEMEKIINHFANLMSSETTLMKQLLAS